jgi:hypothetical protein
MFRIFEASESRSALLRAIEDPTKVAQSEDIQDLISRSEFMRDRQRYSSTFEWFIGEMLIRKFMAFSSSFGVKVGDVMRNSDEGTAGDYDVLSVLGDMSLLYIECKTGQRKLDSILNTIERSSALHTAACVFILGEGVSHPHLLKQLKGQRHPRFGRNGRLARIAIRGIPESEVFEWYDCFFVPAKAGGGDLEQRLRTVMRVLAAYRSTVFEEIRPEVQDYRVMGYEYSDISL